MALPARKRHSYAEYLRQEAASPVRLEFLGGEIRAMAGGTLRHSRLKLRLARLVDTALDRAPCMAFDADAKVRIAATDHSTYPDLSIVCGPVQRSVDDPHAMVNPTVLFEVLSPSTEAWDRGGKFISYQQLDSLQHYVLIAEARPVVEHFARGQGGRWTYVRLGPGDTLRLSLPGGQLAIDVDELYRDLPEEPPAEDEGPAA